MPSNGKGCLTFQRTVDANFHDKALDSKSELVNYNAKLYNRSLYAYVRMYNRLPQGLINSPTVASFQSRLTHLAKQRAIANDERWRNSFKDSMAIHEIYA